MIACPCPAGSSPTPLQSSPLSVPLAALVPLAVLAIAMLALAVVTVAVLALHGPIAVLLSCRNNLYRAADTKCIIKVVILWP